MASESPELQTDPTPEELEAFRGEIIQLYEDEQSKKVSTGHFTDPSGQVLTFKKEDLGLPEFSLGCSFQACRTKTKPISYCLGALREYRMLEGKEELSLAQRGLVSFVGNKLTFLDWCEELDQRKKDN